MCIAHDREAGVSALRGMARRASIGAGWCDMRAVLALATMLGWLTSAHAGNDVGVVVVGDGTQLAQISAHLSSWLSQHGRALVSAPIPVAAMDGLIDCVAREQLGCARHIVKTEATASVIVYVRVGAERGGQEVALTAYWIDKARPVISERGGCQRCTNDSLSVATDELMTRLLRAVMRSMARVKLRSSPSGARIVLDGDAIGVTPLDWDVAPGKHTISMQDGRGEPRTRTIVARADATEVIDMTLAEVAVGPSERGGAWRRALPLVAMGAGAAAVVTGAALIAIHQERSPDAPLYVRNTAPAGVGIAIAGGVVAAVGAVLWVRAPEARSAPVAAVTAQSALVGWVGRF
jgi:hypothetical protein